MLSLARVGWTGQHSVWGAWLRTRKRNCGEVEYCFPPNAAATPLQDSKPTGWLRRS
jgi:hypothetical protein